MGWNMSRKVEAPACPSYLSGSLQERFNALAPVLTTMGTLDELNADLLAKYVLAENDWLRVSSHLQNAIKRGDGDDAAKWLLAQDRLTKQILSLGDELGLTPKARRARGLTASR